MTKCFFYILVIISTVCSCNRGSVSNPDSVKEAMDNIVTRFYQTLSSEQLDTIGTAWILANITENEKKILATKYWYFTVNMPVTVSLMRDMNQNKLPFWLQTSGFKKTGMVVRNEHSSYEVWQKDSNAGMVELGINGFDKHRPVYFICVGPQDPANELEITGIFPEGQYLDTMDSGAFTYHDWDELVLSEVPDELKGQVLFTTIRGRAREAHLTGAFRSTPYPSGAIPDQLMLTWSRDPSTSIDIQWRTSITVPEGSVKYWLKGSYDTLATPATLDVMEDRLLQNDRYIHRFTALLDNLEPGAAYFYRAGSDQGGWSETASFHTDAATAGSFSFIWFGDTHKSGKWGDLIQESYRKHPGVEFFSIAGDLVSTGLYRDEWDQLFHFSEGVFSHKPFMPVPGNHDSQDGLGAWMYRDMFSLPENGPDEVMPELSYSFMYGNSLFMMIDVTSPVSIQSKWIDEQLKNSDAVWKFAMFHFPPYNYEEDYSEIRREWCTLFDKYHVDMVMSGHTHYYMRSKPVFNGKVVDHPSKGTIYVISVGIPGNHQNIPDEDYAEVTDGGGWQYQHIEINGGELIYKSLDIEGNARDTFVISKKIMTMNFKKHFLIIGFLLAFYNMPAQQVQNFESEVDTEKKPWTNLNFYNDPDNFQFIIVSDRNGGNRPGIFEDAVKKINYLYPEFVLSVGDLINGYTRDTAQLRFEWEEVNQIIDSLKMPFFYLPGNHDITNRVMAEIWEDRYGKRYYYFTYKNTLFIILDSNDDDDHSFTREQTDFVVETLAKNPDVRWTFLLMHHPVWNYDTGGRFEEMEEALSGRKSTVIAGHTHHYFHENRKGRNYYVLATTGAGSALRGHHFGEFDHITWVTMTDAGPSLANLRLDGILPHDVANSETESLAGALAGNASFQHVMLCNEGENFTDGTLYFYFENTVDQPMAVNLRFYHQHQLEIMEPNRKITLAPGEQRVVEIPFSSPGPVPYNEAEAIQIDWQMGYDLPEYPDFLLSGRLDLAVAPTKTTFVGPQIPKFLNSLTVSASHPYKDLTTVFGFNNMDVTGDKIIEGSKISIEKSGDVSIKLTNDAGQSTTTESRYYERIDKLHKAAKVRKPKTGLKYSYYEGTWDKLPDFDPSTQKADGVAKDFWVSDYALREDHFGMVYSGYLMVEEDGLYVFRSNSDDASRIVIHNETVVNQDRMDEDFRDVGAIALRKGYHPVKIYFLEDTGRERLRLYMKRTYDDSWGQLEVPGRFFH